MVHVDKEIPLTFLLLCYKGDRSGRDDKGVKKNQAKKKKRSEPIKKCRNLNIIWWANKMLKCKKSSLKNQKN